MDTVDGEKLDCVFTEGIGWHEKENANNKCIFDHMNNNDMPQYEIVSSKPELAV